MPPNYPTQLPQKRGNKLLFILIPTILLLIISLFFGFWAFAEREDYKSKSDQKSAAAVAEAEAALTIKKEAEFTEREKEPLKEYKAGSTYGSAVIKYPKTWSAYITDTGKGSTPLDGYMHPGYVPGDTDATAYALHFEVINSGYDQEVSRYEAATKNSSVSVVPITAPLVPGVTGVRITGEVENDKQGVTVLFPIRDKTLKLTVESTDFVGDFDAFILPNLVFVP